MNISVGEILQQKRNSKKLTLEQIEKATKIRLKFLLAIEKNEFNKLPPGTFTKGFIKNYASYLGLPENEILAFYRRQIDEEKGPALPAKPISKPGFSLPPLTTIGISILIILFFAYITFSYFQYAGSPPLTINSPANNSIVTEDQVSIIGKTDPDTEVTINNQPVQINENGSFEAKITLAPGLNTITVVSTNKFHRQTTLVRNLRLEK